MSKPIPASEISLMQSSRAHRSWGLTADRAARTANGRATFENRFLVEADGDPQRAASLKAAYFRQLAAKSAAARRKARSLTAVADAADAELAGDVAC